MNYWEMLKSISPYDYSIKNKLANNTELCREEEEELAVEHAKEEAA